jgi:dynein light intermediate chain 2
MATKKELIHCYEIATKSLSEIMGSLIPKDSFPEAVFVICVDLSKPESVIEKTLQWINLVRKEMDTFVNEKLLTRQDVLTCLFQKYREFMEGIKEHYAENEDKDTIHPMPLHSIMIGCKYDLFERYDTESRKWLSRALRYIAHHNNMSLYFSSTKNMQVGAQLRSYMQENMFKDKKSRPASQFEHIKPIFINNGEDSIHSMNLPTSSSLNTIEILKKQLGSLFGYD